MSSIRPTIKIWEPKSHGQLLVAAPLYVDIIPDGKMYGEVTCRDGKSAKFDCKAILYLYLYKVVRNLKCFE